MSADDFAAELARLTASYVARLPDKAADLEAALDSDDAAQLQRAVHRLGGTAGSYGLSWVSEPAGAIELRLTDGAAVAEVRAAVSDLIAQLRAGPTES